MLIGAYCGTGGTGGVSPGLCSDGVLALCVGPAGIIQLPSRDVLDDDAAGSAVSVGSWEVGMREGESTLVGEDPIDSGSSVRVFVEESRESSEGVVGGRSSRASCSSNWVIGEGETSGCGSSGCIKVKVYRRGAKKQSPRGYCGR